MNINSTLVTDLLRRWSTARFLLHFKVAHNGVYKISLLVNARLQACQYMSHTRILEPDRVERLFTWSPKIRTKASLVEGSFSC